MDKQTMKKEWRLNDDEERVKTLAALLGAEMNRVVIMDMLSSDTIKHVHVRNGKEVDMGEAKP